MSYALLLKKCKFDRNIRHLPFSISRLLKPETLSVQFYTQNEDSPPFIRVSDKMYTFCSRICF